MGTALRPHFCPLAAAMTKIGPSSELISHINHLQQLLSGLPTHLPLNPVESMYHFGLDSELVEEESVWFAFNRNLEVCFETHKSGGRSFSMRGDSGMIPSSK